MPLGDIKFKQKIEQKIEQELNQKQKEIDED